MRLHGWLRWLSILVLGSVALPTLAATTYTYTGVLYTSIANNLTCTAGNCPATYTVAMRVTGSFTTASALAANLVATDISGQVTSYSFNDGINTIASSDPNARISQFSVATDATGAPSSGTLIRVHRWTTGTTPHGGGDSLNEIVIDMTSSPHSQGGNDMLCELAGNSADSADDCLNAAVDIGTAMNPALNTSLAIANGAGAWSASGITVANAPIPTLSHWTLLALSVMLAAVGGLTYRVKRRR